MMTMTKLGRTLAVSLAAHLFLALSVWGQNAAQPAPAAENGTVRSVRAAPGAGRIVGRAVDATTGEPLSNVAVAVMGTSAGALSGVDGRFLIVNVPAGKVTLRAENLGYAPKQVADVYVPNGGITEQDISLAPAAVQLGAITVSASAERGSLTRALDAQRNAAAIVSAVTAEQISRSPDGDAAAALQRVSGVTVQEGKFVYVRGLGERYTTTSLNGARIPSPEPERKLVPLDLFPSGLLQTITTAKTFTPDLSADFSGAQVDIQTREFPARRQLTWSLGLGYNQRGTGQDLPGAPLEGGEWLGLGGAARELPVPLAAAGNFQGAPVTQEDMNGFVRALRNAWTPEQRSGLPNGSLGVSLGGTDAVLGRRLSYLLSGTYSATQEVQAGQVRAQARPGTQAGATEEADRFTGSTGRNSVLWGGLANLSTLFGEHSRVALNATYNRTADAEGRVETGRSENYGQLPMRVLRQRFVARDVFSTQLRGEHQVSSGQRAEWSFTYSGVNRAEPDRSEFVYAMPEDAAGRPGTPQWFSAATEGAVRTFGELSEHSAEGSGNYRLALGATSSWLKLGGLHRAVDRTASSRAYGISATRLPQAVRELPPEQIFGGPYVSPGSDYFTVTPMAQGGAYEAADRLLAGYLMAEVRPVSRLRLLGGARVEHSQVTVAAEPTLGETVTARPEYTDVLPSLSLTWELSENQNLRLSAARTLARPEYREVAEIQYREVLGGDVVRGNAQLRRTRIRNFDARWEWYPAAGEVLSVGAFAKSFEAPIERIYLGTSGTRVVTFVNAGAASNYGLELEARKRLDLLADALAPLTGFVNATVMRSEIELPSDGIAQTRERRPMVGQAPFVLNAGLTYATESGTRSATVLYNLVGEKVYSAAEAPLPEVHEQARQSLDLSLRYALSGGFALKLDARNLLDSPFELRQGSVVRESYRSGRVYSLGFSWTR